MKSIVRLSLKQVVFVNVIFVLMSVAGVFAMLTSPVENMPPVDIGRVLLSTVYFGASAEDVENLVTAEIEDALDGMENIEYIDSKSRRNVSTVDVKFIDDSDYRALYDELRFRVLNVQKDLPEGADETIFFYLDTQSWMPVIIVNLYGELPNRTLKLLADEYKQELLSVPGIREVGLSGEEHKEFHVALSPEKLRRFGVTFDQAAQAVASANTKIPAGRFRTGTQEFSLDAGRTMDSQDDVLGIVVRHDEGGGFVHIRDLVSYAGLDRRDPDIISSVDGKNTLSLLVKKEDSANAISIVRQVKSITKQFVKRHRRDGLDVKLTNDSTIEINDSVRTLGGSLLLGMTLVTLVLWFTLGFRNAMLTAIGIPFSFLTAMLLVKFTGQSINTISLFSFVLVSGIIVDDAVIILENVFRHQQMGKDLREAVVDGVSEVMLPVISSALTTVLAFIPMLIMTGSTGEFFSVIPKTVTYALIASLLEALFILPVHIIDWGPRTAPRTMTGETEGEKSAHQSTRMFSHAWRAYRWTLGWLLAHRVKAMLAVSLTFVAAVVILVLSVTGIVPLINVKFFPGSYFRYHIAVTMPPGTAVEQTDEVVRALSEFIVLRGTGEALAAVGTAGRYETEDYQLLSAHNYGQVVVTLPEEKNREFPDNPENDVLAHIDFIRQRTKEFLSQNFSQFNPEFKIFPENTGPPTGKPVNIRITGTSLEEAMRASDDLMAYLGQEPELADLVDLEDDRPALQQAVRYQPRGERIREYGLSPGAATALVAGALSGRKAGEFRTIDEQVDLMVKLARSDDTHRPGEPGVKGPADILDVPIIEHSASPVRLGDIVSMEYLYEPSSLNRHNGKPTITVSSDIKAGSSLSPGRVAHLVKDYFETIADRHPGVALDFGGEFETTSRTYTSLMFAFFIAVLCIYLVLASQFNDYFQPIIIISAVAFAFIGVVFGMFVTRSTFTVGSFLAVVGLAGVAVNDSLILIDFINVRRRDGLSMREAVLDACSTRMRPVIITTVTTVLGLTPMALGIPHKSVAWMPMATAFVTGLSSATLLTLLVVPVEYELSEKLKLFLRRVFKTQPRHEEATDA